VDVFSVHLPLSEAARDRVVPELRRFMRGSSGGSGGRRRQHVLSVLGGDLNAEPQEPAMRALLDGRWDGTDADAVGPAAAGGGDSRPRRPLHDLWLAYHGGREPTPRDPDEGVRRHALTFPSDDPAKRIDLLLASGGSDSEGEEEDEGLPLCGDSDAASYLDGRGAGSPASRGDGRAAGTGTALCLSVESAFLVGQDALPATEANEGRG
jgi:hypothetical protein